MRKGGHHGPALCPGTLVPQGGSLMEVLPSALYIPSLILRLVVGSGEALSTTLPPILINQMNTSLHGMKMQWTWHLLLWKCSPCMTYVTSTSLLCCKQFPTIQKGL